MKTTATSTKRMTADEFFDWVNRPENEGKEWELHRGEVVEVSRPGERHCLVCANATGVLRDYMRRFRHGYVLSNDPGTILEHDPDTVCGPDVVFHMGKKKYSEMNPKWSEDMPVLAVEVLSPTDRIGKMTKRINDFLKAGIKIVWLIDPEARDVTVFRPNQEVEVLDESQIITGNGVLPDFTSPVSEFFFMVEDEQQPEQSPSPAPPAKTRKRRAT